MYKENRFGEIFSNEQIDVCDDCQNFHKKTSVQGECLLYKNNVMFFEYCNSYEKTKRNTDTCTLKRKFDFNINGELS